VPLPIPTARLLLRPFKDGDLAPFIAMRADPDVARYQSWSSFDHADGLAFFDRMRGAEPDTPGQWFQFAIEMDGQFVGDCAVGLHAEAPHAEIGVTLSRAHQGKGIAHEALSALIHWLIDERGKTHLRAVVDTRNTPALALFAALGFTAGPPQRVMFKGAPCDEITWELTAHHTSTPC